MNISPHRNPKPVAWGLGIVFTAGICAVLALQPVAANHTPLELVRNGAFNDGTSDWFATDNLTPDTNSGANCTRVPSGTENPWDAIVGQNGFPIQKGADFRLSFDVSATPAAAVRALVLDPVSFAPLVELNPSVNETTQSFSAEFTSTVALQEAQVAFQIGANAKSYTFCVDNVSIVQLTDGEDVSSAATASSSDTPSDVEQLTNSGFDTDLAPFWQTGNLKSTVDDGVLCTNVPGGTANAYDAIIGQDAVIMEAGSGYQLSFSASASRAATIKVLVQDPSNYAALVLLEQALTTELSTYSKAFTSTLDLDNAQFHFQIGGNAEPYTFCADFASVKGGVEREQYIPDTGPRLRVNQVSYLPYGPKRATLVTDVTDPVTWQLNGNDGQSIASGQSVPAGVDGTSKLNVHTIDFSDVSNARGDGFTLVADGAISHPFTIAAGIYESLRIDSLSFFYPQRSGTPILGDVAGDAYARPAGHISIAPNTGDLAVPCQSEAESLEIYGEPWTCDYTLDVSGGWYDAGDHGKYVVNGGISVYQLLDTYQRNQRVHWAKKDALGDGTLRVPESANKVPDILDEARWELAWMMSMQVPQGQPLAGMAHHKIHDKTWTGLPLDPAASAKPRQLHRPSTAATLNLAAATAKAYRLYQPYDETFAKRLLETAKLAYDAAKANPELFAPGNDNIGGGPYNDDVVSDEFYWAAAELYLATGSAEYESDVIDSIHHLMGEQSDVFDAEAGFHWGSVAALARIDLATDEREIKDQAAIRQSVLEGADVVVALQASQPWGLSYAPTSNSFDWGSNSAVLNNSIVLATAFDLSNERKYAQAAIESFDYLFGRNALNQSYITGYGENPSKNQHSRWYANQLVPESPNPPPGTVAGGPNSSIQDPVAQVLLAGCVAQFCYIDDIGSWATNELTINWNSALAWMASWMSDMGDGDAK